MYLCICRAVTTKTVRQVITEGASNLDEIERCCGAGGDCGSCREDLCELLVELGSKVRAPRRVPAPGREPQLLDTAAP